MTIIVRRRVNFFTLLGCVVLFLFPWTDIQCSGTSIATQSGLQAMYADCSVSEGVQRMAEEDEAGNDEQDFGPAVIIILAFILIVAGAVVAGRQMLKNQSAQVNPAYYAGGALLLFLLQIIIRFPIDRSVERANAEQQANPTTTLESELAAGIMGAMNIEAKYTPWFYLELILLAVPTGILVHYRVNERKRQEAPPDAAETSETQEP